MKMAGMVKIQGSTGISTIMVGERLGNLGTYAPVENMVVITDTNVSRYHAGDFPPCKVINIDPGEKSKTLDTVRSIYKRLLENGADRSTFIVGIGGGVVCDITGFAASTYLRGVRFGFVSSTLLSQVDASVGGKNGVNFMGYKNMVGVISQPEFVICDPNLLKTLPQKEILCGLAEVVKHALIGDPELFSYLEDNHKKAADLDRPVTERLVHDSVLIKSAIVNRDERENGDRRKLNFGHTFGHAMENTAGVSHGEAVSAGMVMAAEISVQKGYLGRDKAERIGALLRRLKLPVRLEIDPGKVTDALKKDKKRQGDRIRFVLLKALGHAVVEEISIREIEDNIQAISEV
jgi:3-dehydroquinate synthase